jgi:hypothetical protein
MKIFAFVLGIVVVHICIGRAQLASQPVEKTPQEEIDAAINCAKDGNINIDIRKYVGKHGYAVVAPTSKYLDDRSANSDKIKSDAATIILAAVSQSTDIKQRQEGIEILLAKINDEQVGMFLCDRLIQRFSSADFSEKSKLMIREYFHKDTYPKSILLVGVADIKEELDALDKIVQASTINPQKDFAFNSRAFYALMTRARMGVKDDIKKCINLVEACPDEEFRVNGLLERLSYVRQPEVVEYIRKYYMMDKVGPSGGPDCPGMSYADRAGDVLSLMLRDFPKYKREGKRTSRTLQQQINARQELLEKNRGWIKQQTHWEIIR